MAFQYAYFDVQWGGRKLGIKVLIPKVDYLFRAIILVGTWNKKK